MTFMDIRNWSLDQVMQLPDHCFGRRWPIVLIKTALGPGVAWDISDMALPEQCVIWEVFWWINADEFMDYLIDMRLGDHLPAAAGEFIVMEPLFRDFGLHTNNGYSIVPAWNGAFYRLSVRMPIAAAGRRLVVQFYNTLSGSVYGGAGIVISSIPKEVPDCLLSV